MHEITALGSLADALGNALEECERAWPLLPLDGVDDSRLRSELVAAESAMRFLKDFLEGDA